VSELRIHYGPGYRVHFMRPVRRRQEEPGPRHQTLGWIARSRGMTQIAREAHVSRESLYKSLNGVRKPEFATILKVMGALGVRLRVEAIAKKNPGLGGVPARTCASRAEVRTPTLTMWSRPCFVSGSARLIPPEPEASVSACPRL
jgi:probable addiction module antidote protein